MSEWLIYIIVFLGMFLMDVVWTVYIRSLAQGNVIKAASMSALVYSISALSFVEIVKDTYLLIPAMLGAFLGTYSTLKWEIKHEKNKVCDSTKS